jgi:multiple sugar transport system substrate-binding protein
MKHQAKMLTIAALALALSACGGKSSTSGQDQNNSQEQPKQEAPKVDPAEEFKKKPVTVTLVNYGAGVNNETDLEKIILGPVRQKYPNITIELVKDLAKLVQAGQTPDLIATSNFYMDLMLDMGVATDLNEAVKKYNIDLSNLEPETINALKPYGKNGELYGMPYSMNYGTLIYNKDIFDKFGAPYPTDGMTWDEIIELAKKVTRTEAGIQYLGIDPGYPQVMTRQLSLPVTDASGEKAAFQTEGYQKVFQMYRTIYSIPGMIDPNRNYLRDNVDIFLKEQRVAMQTYWIAGITSRLLQLIEGGQNFNWDLVSFPSFAENKGVGREIDFHLLMVTPAGKDKEAVYRVLEAMQTKEAQIQMNKDGRLTAWKDPEIQKDFAVNLNIFNGKNLAGIFTVKPAPAPRSSMYDNKGLSFLNQAMNEMIKQGTDINTLLRKAEEQTNQYIQEELQKKAK